VKHFVFWAIFIAVALMQIPSAFAEDIQFEVGGGLMYFAGKPYQSLAPKTGYMVRFGAGAGRQYIFKWVSSFSMFTSSGNTTFNDNGTYTALDYQLVGGEFNLGLKIAPLASLEHLPMQPYVGASGAATSASFKFPENAPVSTTFPKTDSSNYYGYNIFVGVDIEMTKSWGVNFLVEQSKLSGTLANNQFNLDSNRVLFQLFFRN